MAQVREWRHYYPKAGGARARKEAGKPAPSFYIRSPRLADIREFQKAYLSSEEERKIGEDIMVAIFDPASILRRIVRDNLRNIDGYECGDKTIENIDELFEEADQILALEIYQAVLGMGEPNAGNSVESPAS